MHPVIIIVWYLYWHWTVFPYWALLTATLLHLTTIPCFRLRLLIIKDVNPVAYLNLHLHILQPLIVLLTTASWLKKKNEVLPYLWFLSMACHVSCFPYYQYYVEFHWLKCHQQSKEPITLCVANKIWYCKR